MICRGYRGVGAFRSKDSQVGQVVHAVVLPSAVSGDTVPALPAAGSRSGGAGSVSAISPDGMRLAYVGVHDEKRQLYLRALDKPLAEAIPGTEGAFAPFFSYDGAWLGFVSDRRDSKQARANEPPPMRRDRGRSFLCVHLLHTRSDVAQVARPLLALLPETELQDFSELRVSCVIDLTHPARSQGSEDLVIAELGPIRKRHCESLRRTASRTSSTSIDVMHTVPKPGQRCL